MNSATKTLERLKTILANRSQKGLTLMDHGGEFTPHIIYPNGYLAFAPGSKYSTVADAAAIVALDLAADALLAVADEAGKLALPYEHPLSQALVELRKVLKKSE